MPEVLKKILNRRSGVIVSCTMGTFVNPTPTVNTVFGFFLIPLSTEFGWHRSTVSAALFVVAVASALSFPVIGRLGDRYGVRPIILVGNVLFAASVALLSLTQNNHFMFYAAYALVGITGATMGQVLLTKVIAGWFDENRGLFLGLMGGVGNGVGATLMPIYVHYLITTYGWRGAYTGIGIAIFVIAFPALFFLLREPPGAKNSADSGPTPQLSGLTLEEAFRTNTFWLMLSSIALGAGCVTAVFTHVVPMLLDRGMAFDKATTVLSVFALVTVVWQISVGFLLDRFPRPRMIAPFFVIAAGGVLLLQMASSYAFLLLAAVFMGIGLGTEYGVLPFFISRYFGLKAYGAISGVMYATIILFLGITPALMDLAFDITGSYREAVAVIAAGLVIGAGLMARLKPFDVLQSRSSRKNPPAEPAG